MNDGVAYYNNLFEHLKNKYGQTKEDTLAHLEKNKK